MVSYSGSSGSPAITDDATAIVQLTALTDFGNVDIDIYTVAIYPDVSCNSNHE